jgi:hypothetical protein
MIETSNLTSEYPPLEKFEQSKKKLSLARSHAIINNLVPGIALAKEMGVSMEKFIKWNVDKYYHHGYHDLWIQHHGLANIRAYSKFFINGRQLVCNEYTTREENNEIIVESKVWYLTEISEALFFYDVELDELCSFISGLATAHAKICGIDLCIKYLGKAEIASLRPIIR